jgi:hypothetical protein
MAFLKNILNYFTSIIFPINVFFLIFVTNNHNRENTTYRVGSSVCRELLFHKNLQKCKIKHWSAEKSRLRLVPET